MLCTTVCTRSAMSRPMASQTIAVTARATVSGSPAPMASTMVSVASRIRKGLTSEAIAVPIELMTMPT